MNIYESSLLTPSGKKIPGIKYYELEQTAKQIVELNIERDPNYKEIFEEFKKGYNHYSPYIDFIICILGYKFINPFITEEGYLYGKDGNLYYVSNPFDQKRKKIIKYPKADDLSLHLKHVNIDDITDSLISPDGLCYKIIREEGDFHQQFYEIILMQNMIHNKTLYEDYINCYTKHNDVYNLVNIYFRNRLGYLQVIKYENDSGYVLYNEQLKSGYIDNLLSSIKEFYPAILFEESVIPEEMVETSKEIQNEMSDRHESRRL